MFFPLVIPFVVSFSLFIFAFQLHSLLNSFRKLYNLLLVSYFSLIYLFNFSYILQVDIIIYFIICIIHFYFSNNFDIPNRLFGYGNLAIPSIHEIAFEIKIVVSSYIIFLIVLKEILLVQFEFFKRSNFIIL